MDTCKCSFSYTPQEISGLDCYSLAIRIASIIEDLGDDLPHNALCTPCGTGDDIHLYANTTYDIEMKVGNIFIHSGAQLTVTAELQFGKNKSLTIEDGGKLIVAGGKLTTCPGVYDWKGVIVQAGGEMEAINASIRYADTGINAHDGSTLNLDNNEIVGRHEAWAGIYMDGDVQLIAFKNTRIRNYLYGIFGTNNSQILNLDQGNISNTTYAIYLVNATNIIYIHDYTIDASVAGIYLSGCPGSVLRGNDIEFGLNAIKVKNSKILYVLENSTTHTTHSSNTAIDLLNCEYARIYNNDNINATSFGIKAFQSNAIIDNNTINVQGQNNATSGGIQLTNNLNSIISNNFITANYSSFGIESISGQNNEISHNEVSVFSTLPTRTAAIRTMGGIAETIDNNVINGLANVTGIIAQNVVGNTYECNDITNTVDGIAILYNSAGQDIKGNKFLDNDIDLTIRSVIGQQNYTGNEFVNGSARAIGLDIDEIEESIFFVNENYVYHMPSDPVPGNGEWFVNDPNQGDYYECMESPGPIVKFHEDEDKLSAYFDKVKLLQNTQPNVFYTRLYHLLKYEQTEANYTLPNYIKQDLIFTDLCGLQVLVDITTRLEALIKSNNNLGDAFQEIQSLQNEYVLATDESTEEIVLDNLSQSLALLKSGIDDKFIIDNLAFIEMKNDLENINCAGAYAQKWRNIYLAYIDYIQTGEVAEKHKSALVEYSQECSDQYGDAIHIARALANTFDLTYFDVYDGCQENKNFKSSVTDNSLQAFIQPNPSKGSVTLHIENQITGVIKVVDLTGRVVHTDVVTDKNQHRLNLNLNGGLYFIYLTTDTGKVFVEKIILAK